MRINSSYAPLVLRVGLAFVFYWFGFSQLHNQAMWTGLVPDWITAFGLSKATFVTLNGIAELIAATALGLGIYVRWVALLLSLHMASIVMDLGLSAVGIRDVGLSAACLSLFFMHADRFQMVTDKMLAHETIHVASAHDNAPPSGAQM